MSVKPSQAEQRERDAAAFAEFKGLNDEFRSALGEVAGIVKKYVKLLKGVEDDAAEKAWAQGRFAQMVADSGQVLSQLSAEEAALFDGFLAGLGYSKP